MRWIWKCISLLFVVLLIGACSAETVSSVDAKNQFKEKVELGYSKSEILEALGDFYTEVPDSMTDLPVWRYDLLHDPTYTVDIPENIDTIDIEGLKNGNILLHTFIGWSDEEYTRVTRISIIYVTENNEIWHYIQTEDGLLKDEKIID